MPIDYRAALHSEAARFVDVLSEADLTARVPTCPHWRVDDLLYHLAETFLFWASVIRERADDPDPIEAAKPAKPTARADLLALYERCTSALFDSLDTTDDNVAVWTWSDDHTVGFIRRRMPHEALIHRLDAELVADALSDVDPALAADGVHELLQHFYTRPGWSSFRDDGPVGRLHATDTDTSWLVRVGGFSGLSPNTGKSYDDEPCLELVDAGEPSFAVSATARDLDAWLWNRPALVEPVVAGRDTHFRTLTAIIAKGID
jgi:uncharacterized protein (TIGR03083 family)